VVENRRPRILIVDDNEANRYAVGRMLRAASMDTFEATSGRQALQLAGQRPDVIVLDVNLPDLNGFDVVRELRKDPMTATIPILHLSASYMTDEDHVFGLDNGANAYLTHPIEPPVFLATIRTLLRASRFEQERGALLAAAERARIEAEAANRAKSEFLATMSHEIRTPINAILGYSQILDMGIAGPVSPEQRMQLDRMRRSAAHLLTLVNELLDLARVESGRMRVESHEAQVDDVVEDALAIARPQALARGITISTPTAPAHSLRFVGDSGRVRQILVNLLSNAVKFSEPGAQITVTASIADPPEGAYLEPSRAYICVHVRDTGIGVDPEQFAAIFEPFVQAETGPTRTWGGSGLGLAISRRLARLMQGDITVSSSPGTGSLFSIWLPAADDQALVETREQPAASRRVAPFDPTILSQLGRIVAVCAIEIAHSLALRLRTDDRFPPAGTLSDAQLIDHIPSYITDLGLAMIVVAEVGVEASMLLHDGNSIRNEVAERHGAQRRRLGWTTEHIALEYEMLGAEIERKLRERGGSGDRQLEGALELITRMLDQATATSVRGFREAGGVED
jgi:signal transduction histidine kinase